MVSVQQKLAEVKASGAISAAGANLAAELVIIKAHLESGTTTAAVQVKIGELIQKLLPPLEDQPPDA